MQPDTSVGIRFREEWGDHPGRKGGDVGAGAAGQAKVGWKGRSSPLRACPSQGRTEIRGIMPTARLLSAFLHTG